jgi:hypothetical protein
VLTREKLMEYLSYDSATGVFTRVKTASQAKKGSVAGCPDRDGYLRIRIDNKEYRAHRLAWLYVHGSLPALMDHINGNPADNRIANLRLATPGQNAQNRKVPKTNSSGHLGVAWNRQCSKWHARITVAGRLKHLGLFDDIEAASRAYTKARAELHEFATDIRR